MSEFVDFMLILASGLFFSELFKRLHLPYVVALIVAGIIIGPAVLNAVTLTPAIEFMGSIGLVFLMFMAGKEVRTDILVKARKKLLTLALVNAAIPASIGFSVALIFGYEAFTALVLATIFVSSSVAIVVPVLEEKKLIDTEVGTVIIGAVIFEDIASLLLLSALLQTADPTTALPLPFFLVVVAVSVVALKYFLPRMEKWLLNKIRRKGFEEDLLLLFITTIAAAAYFELLGLHAIVAGFLIGLILSETIKHGRTVDKLHAITYGFFIPIFLLVIGMETNISVIFEAGNAIALVLAITLSLIVSKVVSGYVASRLIHFPKTKAILVGFATVPQVSTSLAVAFTAYQLGIIDANLQTSIVILSVITVLIVPLVMGHLIASIEKIERKQQTIQT